MQKISTLMVISLALAWHASAQISFSQVNVEAWYGNGEHEVMFVVDFDSDPIGTDSAFAWGIHFDSDSLSGIEIMDLIAQSDPDFSYTGTVFLDNLIYMSNNQTYTNPNAGWFSVLESGDGVTWAWNSGIGDRVGNGQWFGVAVMDPDTWEAEINVPLLETGREDHSVLDVQITPNPASERLSIAADHEISVVLMNPSGQTVYSASGIIESIDLTYLPPGWYVLTVVADHRMTRIKIVVQ